MSHEPNRPSSPGCAGTESLDGVVPETIPPNPKSKELGTFAAPGLVDCAAGVGWAVGLKYTEGFTKPLPTIATIVAIIGSLGLLGIAVRDLPVGTAYAVWTGIGTLGTLVVGVLLLGDSASPLRLLSGLLIVLGILGLKLTA